MPRTNAVRSRRSRAPAQRRGYSREKILERATKMFADRGFSAISIRDISSACQLSIPSIYHFFGNKEGLYVACCQEIYRDAEGQLQQGLAANGGQTPKKRIEGFTLALCTILMENVNFRRLLQREILREKKSAIEELSPHHFRNEFLGLSQEIRKLDDEVDPIATTFSIYALAFGMAQLRRISEQAGMDKTILRAPASVAQHVLSVVLPEHSWFR